MQTKRGLPLLVSLLFVICAATAIALPAQTLTTLYRFCSQAGCPDGYRTSAGLVQATDGNFYGTTGLGGATGGNGGQGWGTVFKITPNGTLTTLHSFDLTDGYSPSDALVQPPDGNFYGVTYWGGPNCGGYLGCGTVFRITPSGTLTMLHNFDQYDGSGPSGGLMQGTDGYFYGTTVEGGDITCNAPFGCGTVFKMSAGGTVTTLHSFEVTDGFWPTGGLVQAPDGNFYGTTQWGGANDNCTLSFLHGCGTVFKITPGGTLTMLHSFDGPDGAQPHAGLVQGRDGNFYGTTDGGGTSNNCTENGVSGCGTVFKISAGGTLTTLHSFQLADGYLPFAKLLQATDGNFYGTTYYGGGSGNCPQRCGTLFAIAPSGTLTTLHSFDGTDGSYPEAGLIQAIDGNFYGTTTDVGQVSGSCNYSQGCGTVFSLSGPPPSPVQFVPVTPCRLVDTRPQYGGSGPIQGGTFRNFPIPQEGGCNISTSAAAYSLNVTVVPNGYLGYLTIWPTGEGRPVVATLDSLDGRTKADAAIVPAGDGGAVSIYVTNTTNVVLDIDGYFAPVSGSTLAFYPLTPCRVADTRKDNFPQGLGAPYLPGGQPRDFPILNATSCNIPSSAAAYSLNFSVVPYPPGSGSPLGYLEVWPTDQKPQNPVSTLNNLTGTIVANAAIVPAGTGGEITVFPSNATDVVIDINGYFAPAGTGGLSLYPAAPCRVLDTRPQYGGRGAFSGLLSPPVDVVASPCGVPSTAQAYVFNATVVPTGGLGYLTLWPDPLDKPTVSTLSAIDGWIANNMAIVPSTNGKVDAFASGLTQLILDISSYFAP